MSNELTRRRFLRDAGGAAAGALAMTTPASLAIARRRPTVAVFGGGIAGLTAAHELAERGFDVTVYERRAWGGKARSTEVPGSASGGRRPLPGEHSLRIFFGFYQNTIDTFRRIPFGSNPNGVFDNLVAAPQVMAAREGKRNVVLPFGEIDARPYTAEQVIDTLYGAFVQGSFPPDDIARYLARMAVYFSSCEARRVGEWERTPWTEFVHADRYSEDFRRCWIKVFSEFFQASKPERTSAYFSAGYLETGIYSLLGFGTNGANFRVLNLPTNEALIDPWLNLLRRMGVRLRNRHTLTRLEVRNGRIAGARIRGPRGVKNIQADWYVCALPAERARRLLSQPILAADPSLARMHHLSTDWMNGMKFFLREERPILRGHLVCADAPWTFGTISQAQFWPVDFAKRYGDGQVRESLSVCISNWNEPGVLYGKPARECSEEQIAAEVWEQMKRHFNDDGKPVLTDDLMHSWDIDPGMIRKRGRLISEDPLVLPTVDERKHRPDVTTAIPNLLLAGDYLKSEWDVANMETASYNARRAVNALLDRAGSREPRAAAIERYRPPEWDPLKRIDAQRYRRGLPNLLDAQLPPTKLRALLRSGDRR